jgi:N-acetylglucosamine-6-phosphate deacetylase
MRPLTHRDPGPIPELLAAAGRGDVVVELIGDGTHVAPELVLSIFELVGAQNVALVTDSMAAAGVRDGAYRLGSLDVTVFDGVARLTEGGAIAGGTANLLDVVRATVAGGAMGTWASTSQAHLWPRAPASRPSRADPGGQRALLRR